MSCTFRHQESPQLLCSFPTNAEEIQALTVYFNSDSGQEWTVSRCVRPAELECSNKPGFFTQLSNKTQFVTKLPKDFVNESGYFRCQIPGLQRTDIKRCRWPPPDDNINFSTSSSILETIQNVSSSQDEVNNLTDGDPLTAAAVIGIVIGALIFIAISIAFIAFKKRKVIRSYRRHTKPIKEDENSNVLLPSRSAILRGATKDETRVMVGQTVCAHVKQPAEKNLLKEASETNCFKPTA